MQEARDEVWINSVGLTLEEYLTKVFGALRCRMAEMEIRKDLSPAERLGHFSTLLRRQFAILQTQNDYKVNRWTEKESWTAPFTIRHDIQPMEVWFNGKKERMTCELVQNCSNRATSMTDEERVISDNLTALEHQIVGLDRQNVEMVRLNRSAEDLYKEAETAAKQFQTT